MHNNFGMHPALKLRHIRAFLEIASTGSLSAVARAQGISQPALSRTLAEAETLLGTALFRRENRRLVLTEHGARFRQLCRWFVIGASRSATDRHARSGQA